MLAYIVATTALVVLAVVSAVVGPTVAMLKRRRTRRWLRKLPRPERPVSETITDKSLDVVLVHRAADGDGQRALVFLGQSAALTSTQTRLPRGDGRYVH
jgi:hypothetical protein